MTAAKSLEYRITQQLLARRQGRQKPPPRTLAARVINVAAVTAGLVLLGSYLQSFLWVVLAASTVLVLGISEK
jgi:hypothetical protein